MRVVIQRVSEAEVTVDKKITGKIDRGLLVYVSVGKSDGDKDVELVADKLVNLRIFDDGRGKMNFSVTDTGGSILLISNFTLHGDCRRGRRPGFEAAGRPQAANELYEKLIAMIGEKGVKVQTGIFAAHMHVSSVNDGPVTFWLDTQ